MKHIKISLAIIISATLIISCKKKESTTTTTTSTTTTGATPHVNTMTAKVNGADWAMANSQSYAAYSISKFSNTYQFTGQTAFSNPYTSIGISFPTTVTPGTYTLGSNYYEIYTDVSNNSFSSLSGTLNITTIDTLPTSQGIFNKFKATFSFVTNTVAFTSTVTSSAYSITTGAVDFIKQ